MKRPVLLGQACIPGSNRMLKLYKGKDDASIVLSGAGELMSTRKHASEDALGSLPCKMLNNASAARVLIGGLGMGFTLAAVLAATGPDAVITVAELVPEVIVWNRGELGDFAGRPLDDARATIFAKDVSEYLRDPRQHFDVIALDVDNGPEALSANGNNWIYSTDGIAAARDRLLPGGIIAYWSATPDHAFAKKLRNCGLRVIEKSVYAHGDKGARHTIWLAFVQRG